MTVWWGKERLPSTLARLDAARVPALFAGERREVADSIRARIRAFTPTWRPRGDDAGEVLVRLYSEAVESVHRRLRRWPEKALVEYLAAAGVTLLPPSPARAIVTFTVAPTAKTSVLVAAGFQLEAEAPGTEPIVFETMRDVFAAPATIAALAIADGPRLLGLPPAPPSGWRPFSATGPRALWIGFAGDSAPGPRLSLGVGMARDAVPSPASAGGVLELPVPPRPHLVWEVLDGTTLVAAELIIDDSDGFARSGVVELGVPATWRPGIPPGLDSDMPLRWLCVRVAGGMFAQPVELDFLVANAVDVIAASTVRDEVLEEIPDSEGRRYKLAQVPVLPGTLVLEIDEGEDPTLTSSTRRWREVSDLGTWGPDDRVYLLDPTSGVVTFGDGTHGALGPAGFRHVHALAYRVAGAFAGAASAGTIATLRNAATDVVEVKNPAPAVGSDESESFADAVRRGPEEVRARGRAVTIADYELYAPQTVGADVRRAHAWQGHPSAPDFPLPGVVTVVVVPADRGGPPMPDGASLAAVATYLSERVAPAGVEVVAVAPFYHHVRVEAEVILDPTASVGDAIGILLADLDRFLHPLTGGPDGTGWPFGGAIRHADLVRRLAARPHVRAVPRLDLVVDGERISDCQDVALRPHALLWPEAHEVVPVRGETP
ncbi:MAG: putative baseplate assembly protein [Kofleriaceae bacterium]